MERFAKSWIKWRNLSCIASRLDPGCSITGTPSAAMTKRIKRHVLTKRVAMFQ